MKGQWIVKPKNDAVVVFVHGILSDGDGCWRHPDGSYWPRLVADDPALSEFGTYVFTYRTGLFTGGYGISDIVDVLKELLILDEVIKCHRLIFVCHSMGGIVVRKFLLDQQSDLISKKIMVDLFLVASPSLGSDYADWLAPLARVFGHKQAEILRSVSGGNSWLTELGKRFLNFKEGAVIPLRGKELVEDTSIVLRWLWRKQVVQPFAGATFFGDQFKVPGSDHFSIAKPSDGEAIQHRLLRRFILDAKAPSVSVSPASTASQQAEAITKTPSAATVSVSVSQLPSSASIELLVKIFLGSDPLQGKEAQEELVARGDPVQAELFSNGPVEWNSFQVYRRWLDYVARRPSQLEPVFFEKLADKHCREPRTIGLLCAGLPRSSPITDKLSSLIESGFDRRGGELMPGRNFYPDSTWYADLVFAYGHAGGRGFPTWEWSSCELGTWEKLRTSAFRATCAAFAKGSESHGDTLVDFLTYEYNHDSLDMELLPRAAHMPHGSLAVGNEDVWFETTFGAFARWHRGAVVDEILRHWSMHDHPRVRFFGTKIAAAFGFARLEAPLLEWRRAEPDREVVDSIDYALRNTWLCNGQPAEHYIERVTSMGYDDSQASEEFIVTLARTGVKHAKVDAMLNSQDSYRRAIAVLAKAYLRDEKGLRRSSDMLKEASDPLERLLIITALTLLGRSDLPTTLHGALVEAASGDLMYDKRVDVRYIHVFLQIAIADGLKIGATTAQQVAWKREFEPLPWEP